MLIDQDDLIQITAQAMRERESEQRRLQRIGDYVRGKQDPPYTPKGVNAEYRWIAKKARRNFLKLVISVISQNLHVDGYRPTGTTANQALLPQRPEPEWDAFRANRMISRQHGVHRSVIKYGSAYNIVLPGQMATDEERQGDSVPVIRPVSPRRMTAFYADDVDDEWPQFAIEVRSVDLPGQKARVYVSVYDERMRYILVGQAGGGQLSLQPADADDPLLNGQAPVSSHDLGVCPVVRFLYEADLDGEDDCSGEVEPLMPIQDQINFDTFNLMISEQFAAFRQRWVTGMAPVDESGREQQPFRPGVDRMFAAEDPGTKFGDFSETALAPYSSVREDGIRHMSTISQVPPYHLLGQIANLSAEALAAARDGLDRKVEELQALLMDPWRNTFRLTALASGDKTGWNDLFGTVIWRDTSARAFGATIDGLTKVAQMLGVPEEELWARIPGVTADDVAAWRLAKQRADAQAAVQQAVAAQNAGLPVAPLLFQPGAQPGQPGNGQPPAPRPGAAIVAAPPAQAQATPQ
jgi:hypothetical protein